MTRSTCSLLLWCSCDGLYFENVYECYIIHGIQWLYTMHLPTHSPAHTDHLPTICGPCYQQHTDQLPTRYQPHCRPHTDQMYQQHTVPTRPGFSLGLNDRALRPVVLVGALSFFLSALSFFRSPLVSSGFYQRYFELEFAESIQLRRIVARFSCTTLLFASEHRRHLGFMSQISAWEWGYANGIWRNVIFAIVYLESG